MLCNLHARHRKTMLAGAIIRLSELRRELTFSGSQAQMGWEVWHRIAENILIFLNDKEGEVDMLEHDL